MCTLLTLLDFFIRFQCTERNTAFLHFFSIYTIGREKEKLRKDLIKNFFYRYYISADPYKIRKGSGENIKEEQENGLFTDARADYGECYD